jgi:ferredoxin-NADP reductase
MFQLTIINKRTLTPEIVELTLESRRPLPRWLPGQYATLGLVVDGREQWRCFSMTNLPNGQQQIQFALKIGGNFTKALAKLTIGAKLKIQLPYGEFVVNPELDRQLVMIAGGIGITPLMAMMRAGLVTRDRSMALLYSFRSLAQAAYLTEIIAMKKQNPLLTARFFTDSKDDMTVDTHGESLTNDFIGEKYLLPFIGGDWAQATYFICGPPPFIAAVADVLRGHGVPDNKLIHEDFTDAVFAKKSENERQVSRWVYGLTAAGIVLGVGWLGLQGPISGLFSGIGDDDDTQFVEENNTSTPSNSNSNSNSNSDSNTDQPQPRVRRPSTRVS